MQRLETLYLHNYFLHSAIKGVQYLAMKGLTLFALVSLHLSCASPFAFSQQTPASNTQSTPQQLGVLTGVVVDKQTGAAIPAARIAVVGTKLGAVANLNGKYTIKNVPMGTYSLSVSSLGYAKLTVTNVKVVSDKPGVYNITMATEDIVTEEIVVEARALRNTEAILLKDRQKAAAVSDAISAEAISQAGSSNAAEAMGRVTGASVMDGKYVYVRGLGDRYSNAQLNSSTLPSADPDRRTVQMDMFPSNLLDNIVITKTFTPDKPGDFTGGSVNISTKSFPEAFTMRLTSSTSYNTIATFNQNYLTYDGSGTDWLGMDDGARAVPSLVGGEPLPDLLSATRNLGEAQRLDAASKQFSTVMVPKKATAPINQGYSFSVGDKADVLGIPLGILGSLTYSTSYSVREGEQEGRWKLTGKVDKTDALNNEMLLSGAYGSNSVLWGGLLNLSAQPALNHEVGVNLLYNQSGQSSAHYLAGYISQLDDEDVYETRTLRYTERTIQSIQGRGKHLFEDILGIDVDWSSAYTSTSQDEPDLRFFTNSYSVRKQGERVDTFYYIEPSIYFLPSHYFRFLDENLWESAVNISVPFKQWSDQKATLKVGGLAAFTRRNFHENQYEMRLGSVRYNGNPEAYFSADSVGLLSTNRTPYRFGSYIQDNSSPRNNYDATQDIFAVYGMVDMPIVENLRFIGGVRYESTKMDVASRDTSLKSGILDDVDILPSVNFIYQVVEGMNVRMAYSKTLARPTFRELAPFASFEFVRDNIFIGNAELERTLVQNADLRWEWFTGPGEILAVSGFYKDFTNPIERVILNENGEIQFQNVDKATVYGAEFEISKQLGFLTEVLQDVRIGANLSLIHSEVQIAESEMKIIRAVDPQASTTRSLQGQSPYILNLDAGYSNFEHGTNVTFTYNIFGERLSDIAQGGTPDVFEQAQPMLNLTASQKVIAGLSLKLSARNLLDASFRKTQTYKGKEYIYREYKLGQSYSLGLSYSFD